MQGKIAITPRSLSQAGHPALSNLTDAGFELVYPNPGKTPSETDLLDVIPDCVGWLAGVEPISRKVLDAAGGLRVISRNGSGVDNINLADAEARGIKVERIIGANARSVAELAVALLMAATRHIPWSDAHLRSGDWQRRVGFELKGRTLGVVGCGAIGRQVSEMALGLGMNVIGYDPFPNNDFAPAGFRFGALDDIWRSADAVTFHCPPSDTPILDSGVIEALQPGTIIVNTARAGLIDDIAMLDGLKSGQVGCLATDVFHSEPPEMTPLLAHDRVILMPHAGGLTAESVERATRGAVDNILKVLEQK
ncbi:phosphoglycerate dehydrogenase [Pacificoceanicola onchidii]|uniref:phosphoglycerate dehydrogenase n=1 Tax=Pacificoceanicola onchidii TaxID=2562685 RepID=UPI0010A65CEF|nr:phosphoglycerate dehydrogenase [Pacificoceanicola onchidii]